MFVIHTWRASVTEFLLWSWLKAQSLILAHMHSPQYWKYWGSSCTTQEFIDRGCWVCMQPKHWYPARQQLELLNGLEFYAYIPIVTLILQLLPENKLSPIGILEKWCIYSYLNWFCLRSYLNILKKLETSLWFVLFFCLFHLFFLHL